MSQTAPRLYLIDASGYIFRAYHALPALTRASDGLPVGALAGYCNMLFKFLEEMKVADRPTHLVAVFDRSERTFRSEMFPAYKAQRPPAPEDLVPQFALIRDATRAFNVPCVELEGFEADDIIATYARAAAREGALVRIVSSDKDLMQLVEESRIELFDPMKNKPIGVAEVLEKFGVAPDKVIEVQALMGDSVDNVPGCPGIGQKTAAELIGIYGSIEALLARLEEIKQPKRREALIQHAEAIRLSKVLVTLKDDVELAQGWAAHHLHEPEPDTLLAFLDLMEFRTLGRRVRDRLGLAPAALIPAALAQVEAPPSDAQSFRAVRDLQELAAFMARASGESRLGLAVITNGADAARARPIGIGLALAHFQQKCSRGFVPENAPIQSFRVSDPTKSGSDFACDTLGPGSAIYVPLDHQLAAGDLFGQADAGHGPAGGLANLALDAVLALLKPVLEDGAVRKIGFDTKAAHALLAGLGIALRAVDDVQLLSYTLSAGQQAQDRDAVFERVLGAKPLTLAELLGTGKARIGFAQLPIETAARYGAQEAEICLRAQAILHQAIAGAHLRTVYETLDRPLPAIVGAMEAAGIKVDLHELSRLSGDFAQRMAALEAQAMALAGQDFNIASPKQLGDILFGQLQLPGGRKTKTGAWSTDAEILEEIAARGEALPRAVLDWRQLSKLRSTYTEALREAVDPATNRVHTSYQLAATSTGRFSSSEPNLQNIPIRTEEGRRIREVFIADPGNVLISADYSQIELRLLAIVADIPELKRAFAEGVDIHALTATERFGAHIAGRPGENRRQAKGINFGIIYGISAFGLARNLGIGQAEASAYIKRYFERFPGIQAYMERTKAFARAHGYVTTLFGRRCWTPAAQSKNPQERQGGERQAINAPLQGAAADIIKRAMIRLPAALHAAGLRARMLLQVHDELVFEAPQDQAEKSCALIKDIMEGAAAPAAKLDVPLIVEAKAGRTWGAAH